MPIYYEKMSKLVVHGAPFEGITISEYLSKLLLTVLEEGEGFSGKRPFGESGWKNELTCALAVGGYVIATFSGDGHFEHIHPEQQKKADEYIHGLINYIFNGPKPDNTLIGALTNLKAEGDAAYEEYDASVAFGMMQMKIRWEMCKELKSDGR